MLAAASTEAKLASDGERFYILHPGNCGQSSLSVRMLEKGVYVIGFLLSFRTAPHEFARRFPPRIRAKI